MSNHMAAIKYMRTAGLEGSMAFCVGPAGRFLTSAWLSSSKVGPKGFRAVIKLNACRQTGLYHERKAMTFTTPPARFDLMST